MRRWIPLLAILAGCTHGVTLVERDGQVWAGGRVDYEKRTLVAMLRGERYAGAYLEARAYEIAPGYLPAGPSLAEMGRHSSPRSILSVDKLSTVMILGYTPDGSQMHFLEPMVSQETLLSQQDFSLDVPMLTTFGREMLYPTTFEATFQGNSWSFVFTDFVSVQ